MSDYEKIKRLTSDVENSCTCETCKNMCHACPCLGTPDDILLLMEKGYINRLAPTIYMVGVVYFGEKEPIKLVAPRRMETGVCTFLDDKGLCELHDMGLKPSEGKLAGHHGAKNYGTSANKLVANSWINPANFLKVLTVFTKMIEHNGKQR